MKPHPVLTATLPRVITKELLRDMVRWFIERERMRTRKLKRSDQHPKRYHLAKNQHLPKP